MSSLLNIDLLFTGLSSVTVLGLGVLVIIKGDSQSINNKLFFSFTTSIALWMLSSILATFASPNTAQLIVNGGFAASIWIAYFFLTFCSTFVNQQEPNKFILGVLTLPAIALSYFSLVGKVAVALPAAGTGFIVAPGELYSLFAIYLILYVVYGIAILAFAYKKSQGKLRDQLAIVLSGNAASAIIAILFSFILPSFIQNANLYKGGIYSVSIFIASITYAIISHQLFDVRVIVRRTVVYSVLLITLFSAYSLLLFLFAQIFNLRQTGTANILLNFIATLAIGFSFDPLRRWLQERTDKFLYRKEYEQQSVLKTLSADLNNVIGLDEALETVMQTIVRTLKIQHAITYVFQPGEGGSIQIKRIKQIGFSTDKNLLLQEQDFVIGYFEVNGKTVSRAQLETELADEARLIRRQKPTTAGLSELIREHARKSMMVKRLTSLDCEVAVPLHLGVQSIGLLLLSAKLSQEHFTQSDLELLDLAGEVAISSIQKARLYEGDQMKSEFVSIASHELLTPISAIEGYLSMILDEHIGSVDEQARGYLEKVYISSRRLSQLVKDLLSVSRIESGKMTVNLQAVDMQKMIRDTVDQLRFLAQNKGLELNYEAAARTLPMVRADPDRVMQILINLVSNAIKYTPNGSVTITTSRPRRGILKIEVSDTGLGLSKEQRLHLFEKFYRVDSSETVGIIGTGLGLYITKSILERMGGTIAIESILGRGSTFSITLPIFEAEASLPVA